jgi:hypothetical protein
LLLLHLFFRLAFCAEGFSYPFAVNSTNYLFFNFAFFYPIFLSTAREAQGIDCGTSSRAIHQTEDRCCRQKRISRECIVLGFSFKPTLCAQQQINFTQFLFINTPPELTPNYKFHFSSDWKGTRRG